MIIKRAMKAETCTDADLESEDFEYPVYCSNKIDGWRALVLPEKGIVTQSLKSLNNKYIRRWFHTNVDSEMCLDGELVTLDDEGNIKEYNDIQSELASGKGMPIFQYIVFDCFKEPTLSYSARLDMAHEIVSALNKRMPKLFSPIKVLPHLLCHSAEEIKEFYSNALKAGHEGIIIRSPASPYKSGRSTLKQAWMLKRKPWEDAEGTIIGFEELEHNMNTAEINERGLTERSSHLAGKVLGGTLGALLLDTQWGDVRVGGGNGLTHKLRQQIWNDQDFYMGRSVTFKYMAYGMKHKPRFPKFKGFRND